MLLLLFVLQRVDEFNRLNRCKAASNDMGFVSSVINGDSIDDDEVVDNNDVVLLCEVIGLESDERSTFAGAVLTRGERSFDGDEDEKTKLRDVSVPDRTTCALRQ